MSEILCVPFNFALIKALYLMTSQGYSEVSFNSIERKCNSRVSLSPLH